MKRTLIPSIWCFCIFFFTSLYSQNSIPEVSLYMSQLGVDDGLSAAGINSITQDNNGYLWVGTPSGLNRFDGYRIKTYLNDPGNNTSLLNNYIENVFVDSRGWLWVMTRSDGLHIYNENEDNFLRIPITKLQDGLFEDSNGDMWFETAPREYSILQVNTKFNTASAQGNIFDDFILKTQEQLYPNLPKDLDKNHITFSKNNGVWMYTNDTLFNYKLKENRQGVALLFKTKIEDFDKVRLGVNPNNEEIVLCSDSEILIFDGKAKKRKTRIIVPQEIRYPRSAEFIDYKNRLWMLVNNSIYRVSLDTKEWEKIKLQSNGSSKELLKYTKSIYQDDSNNIWFGTRGYGVFKHSIISEAFNYVGNGRIGPSIHKIEQYNDSSLLISVSHQKFPLKILNYKNNTITDLLLYERSDQELNNVIFADFFKDSQERFWLPSKKTAQDPYTILLLNNNLELTQEIECPRYEGKETLINHVFETEDGQIWGIGSLALRNKIEAFSHVYLSKWSEEDKQFYIESVFKDHPKDFFFNRCSVTIETPDKSLWFGFEDGGLLNYDRNTKTWKHVLKKDSLNDKNYYNILSSHKAIGDHQTRFMLGTRSGLMIYNHKKDKYRLLDKYDGFKDNVINGILTDNHRNIWLSTNKGLRRHNLNTDLTTNFSAEDGLQSSEFNRAAYFKKEDGTLFFGGVGGLTWFNPDDLEIPLDDSKIKITGLKLNNKIADSLLIKGAEIELPYDSGLITFEFAKLNLNTINRNQYVYKLEKNSKSEEWLNIRDQSSVSFSELSPANYKIYISCFNSAGKIQDSYVAITFLITKPWWCNDWLKLLGFLIIASIVYYVYTIKLKAKNKVAHVKNSISRDLHDEIGSTLSSIAMYGIIAEKELYTNPEKAGNLIHKINESAVSSIESMNDIVWSIKLGNNTIVELIKRIRFYLAEIEETGNWQTSIEYDERISKFTFNSAFIRNIFLIVKESINNALKHSEGSTIDVRFLYDKPNETISIEIEDNGIGIKDATVNYKNSNGLINMHERATEHKGTLEIKAKENKGTLVHLLFSKNT